MSARGRNRTRTRRMLVSTVLLMMIPIATASAQEASCTKEQRREALRFMQTEVLTLAPSRLDSTHW